MPLVSTGRSMILTLAPQPYAVGFWMQVDSSHSSDCLWVVVPSHCVGTLDPSRFCDQHSAVALAQANRKRIEAAASAKFDNEGADPANGAWEGMPVLFVLSRDILD
jgi:hypothetical protein